MSGRVIPPLHTNGFVSTSSTNLWKALFSNFNFIFKLLAEYRKIFKPRAMYYISMDLTRQALQTTGELFLNLGIIFRVIQFFQIIVALGLCMGGGGGICADQFAF